MKDAVLIIDAGSTSIKFSLFPFGEPPSAKELICEGEISGLGDIARFAARGPDGAALAAASLAPGATHEDSVTTLLRWLDEQFDQTHLAGAGHRVAHGGTRYRSPVLIDPLVMTELRRLIPLAPLHQPHNLAPIDALAKMYGELTQFACFDTSFHQTQSHLATTLALPRHLTEAGVKRYGFHGISYEYIADVLPQVIGPIAEGRVVVAHLGGGASLCALRERKSVATTMGFSSLDGLVMSRRSGLLDPGVLLFLLEEEHMSSREISDLLYTQSGLFGISGFSDDMRTLLSSSDVRAEEAIELFVYRVARELGSMAAALGGIDALVFTAGIGENAPEIRRRVLESSGWLGFELDEQANTAGRDRITIAQSRASAWVIPTNEDLMIAKHGWRLIGNMGGAR